MKKSVPILCLANSDKHGNRCVAGLRLDTGGWIRPVSDEHGSALVKDHYITKSGHEPKPLDTVQIGLKRQYPKYNQPENWVISGEDWKLIDTELHQHHLLVLNTAIQREGAVIADGRDSIPKYELKNTPVPNSLTVLRPHNPEFYIKQTSGRRQPRADFRFDGNEYSLSITAPAWRRRVEAEKVTSLPSVDEVADSEEILFTISLGEEFEGRCYKMIAGIFTVDSENLFDI